MFFNDFQHLSLNPNDNRYILTEKFKKELRRGDKGRLEKLLAKKEERLDKLEAKKKKLVDIAHAPRIHPDDVAAGNAGILLKDVVSRESGHLRDINKIKDALKEQINIFEKLLVEDKTVKVDNLYSTIKDTDEMAKEMRTIRNQIFYATSPEEKEKLRTRANELGREIGSRRKLIDELKTRYLEGASQKEKDYLFSAEKERLKDNPSQFYDRTAQRAYHADKVKDAYFKPREQPYPDATEIDQITKALQSSGENRYTHDNGWMGYPFLSKDTWTRPKIWRDNSPEGLKSLDNIINALQNQLY